MLTFLSVAGSGFYFPPVHPIFVHFTAALIPISFLFDALGWGLKKESLRAAGWWTLCLGALMVPLTVVSGWLWMDSMGGVDHWAMPWHKWIGVGLGIAIIPLAVWRGWRYWKGRGPGWGYVLPAVVVLFALTVQGDLGGAMSLGSGVVFKTPATTISTPSDIAPGGALQWKEYLEIK
jgi:uncharacterized membrane protein